MLINRSRRNTERSHTNLERANINRIIFLATAEKMNQLKYFFFLQSLDEKYGMDTG